MISSMKPSIKGVRSTPCSARATVISRAKLQEGTGSVFRVDANDKVTVAANPKFDANCEVGKFIALGGDVFASMSLPLGSTLKKIEGNRYELVVPSIKFFDHSFYPRIIVRIDIANAGTNSPTLRLVSELCEMVGPWVEQYNDRMDFSLDVILSVQNQNLISNAKVKVLGDAPAPLNLIPKEVLSTTGNVATQAVLSAFHKALAEAIVADYNNWAKSEANRNARKESMAALV